MIEFNSSSTRQGDLDPAGRLILALAASLALHFILIFGIQVIPAQRAGKPQPVLEVNIQREFRGADIAAPLAAIVIAPTAQETPREEPKSSEKPEPLPVEPASPIAEPASALLPVIELPLIEDPTWYPAKQVDVHPRAVNSIQPVYPAVAVEGEIEGSVVVLLLIDEAGNVKEASVSEAQPEGIFDESALAAFRMARFIPAQKNGRAVKSRLQIRVGFELDKPGKPRFIQPP